MRLYTTQHLFDCGIALHARTMSVCILDQSGEVLVHRTMQTASQTFLKALAPSRAGLVVAVACLFPGYWLADLCADEGIPVVLGQALSMQAIHGGKAKNDPMAAHPMAAWLRGGMLPQASGSPATRRATRDLLRRRRPLAHTRAALLAHVHNTNSHSHLPALGKKIADTATRDGGAERCAEAAVHTRRAVALALIPSDAALRRDVARTLVNTARPHDAHPRSLRHPVPGLGQRLRLVRLDDLRAIARVPRGPAVLSSCRLVPYAREAAGKRDGTSGTTSGQAPLTWAVPDAAVVFLRDPPAAQNYLPRVAKKQGKGNAVTLLAQPLARAGYSRRKRHIAGEREPFLQCAGRGAEAPEASRDNTGRTSQRRSTRRPPLRQGTPRRLEGQTPCARCR